MNVISYVSNLVAIGIGMVGIGLWLSQFHAWMAVLLLIGSLLMLRMDKKG
ncbi:hypothetical protein KV679_12590 [Bacillus sp. JRC01]|nr:hypothetical protein [Bacillus sp. JRC01]